MCISLGLSVAQPKILLNIFLVWFHHFYWVFK